MSPRQVQQLMQQTGISAEQLKAAGLISASDLQQYAATYTGGQRNQMTAGSNVNWAAVYGFSNMSPQDQAAAGAQGLAPNWNGIPLDFMNAHGGVTMKPDGTMIFGDGTQYNRTSGTPAPWQQQAAPPAGNIVEQARAMGFKPTGPSGTYAYQAQQFLAQRQGGAAPGGMPVAPGGMPGMPNLGNSAQQMSAQVTQGSVDQLRQRAAASGDLDRLPYKEARLRGTLAGAKRQQTTQDALAQVQLAQALAQPYADSAAVAAYRGRL